MNTKAYQAGYSACYFGGVSFYACPYAVETLAYEQWLNGWKDCEAEHYAN